MHRRARRAAGTIRSWLALARSSLVWTLVTVVGFSALGLLASNASYAGASDERVESFAVDTYATFLRRVAVAMLKLAVVEWLVLAFVTLGLAQLLVGSGTRRRVTTTRREGTIAAVAVAVTLAFAGFGAAMHPGLFLGILAGSRVASLGATACLVVAPLLVVASLAGTFLAASRAKRHVQVLFVIAAALAGAAGGRLRTWNHRYKADTLASFVATRTHDDKHDGASKRAGPGTKETYGKSDKSDKSDDAHKSGHADGRGRPTDAPPWGRGASATTPNWGSGFGASGAGSAAAASAAASGAASGDADDDEPWYKRTKATPPARPSSVLWIAVDSLRPDHIDPENTPNLAALVADSIYFPNCITPVPRTGPSWAAALTSLDPITTRIETMFPDRARSDLSTVALPANLVARGYRSAVVSEYAGEFFRRIDAGFDVVAVPRAELMQISGQIMMSRAPVVLAEAGLLYGATPALRSLVPSPLDELIRGMPNFSVPATLGEDVRAFIAQRRAQPSFVLAFYSQPHFPYTSSPAFARRYHVPGSDPSLAYGRDVTSDRPVATDADRRQIDGLYRAALAESDAAIGKLLGELRESGFLDDAIVVLSADHGEGLYECAECVGHGDNLRGMTTLRVPLAFHVPKGRFPAAKPSVQDAYVSLYDVYPTLLDLLGVETLGIHDGVSLLDAAAAPRKLEERTLTVETGEWLWTTAAVPKDRIDYPPITTLARIDGDRIAIDAKYDGVIRAAKHRAAIRAPYKLLYEPSRDGVRYRLFDFTQDPLETKDLSAERPAVLAEMKDALRRSLLRHASVLPVGDYFLTKPAGIPDHHW